MAKHRATGRQRPPAPLTQGAPATPERHIGNFDALSDQELAELLVARPDLAEPPPADLAELYRRANAAESIAVAMDRADAFVMDLVRTMAVCGERHQPVAALVDLLGGDCRDEVDRAVDFLAARGLVARGPDDVLCVFHGFLNVDYPAGLGPPVAQLVANLTVEDLKAIARHLGPGRGGPTRKAELVDFVVGQIGDPASLRRLLDSAPPDVTAYLRRFADPRANPVVSLGYVERYRFGAGTSRSAGPAPSTPSAWLLERGLLFAVDWYQAVAPREVGLAVRGGRAVPHPATHRPVVATVERPAAGPGSNEGFDQAVVAVVERIERLGEEWGHRPAATLKTGGVGVREIRRLAGLLGVEEIEVFRLVDLAGVAGLVDEEAGPQLARPTAAFDEWLALPLFERWIALALTWLRTPFLVSLGGEPDGTKVLPGLKLGDIHRPDRFLGHSGAAGQRRLVLDLVAEAGVDAVPLVDSLAERARWEAPELCTGRDVRASIDVAITWTLEEGGRLGLIAGGSATPLLAPLLAGDLDCLRDLLRSGAAGRTDWQLVLQADLSALVTGPVPAAVRTELDLLADIEQRGAATQYRFSEASLRRAFDAGRRAAQISEFLAEHSATGVPQPLDYLVGDVERRHGRVRVGSAASYVRFDDPAVAQEAVRAKRAVRLGLALIAPTVAVSAAPAGQVLAGLREAGFLPVSESPDGLTVSAPTAPHRATRRAGDQSPEDTPSAADAWRVLADGRSGPVGDRRALARALRKAGWGEAGPPGAYEASLSGRGAPGARTVGSAGDADRWLLLSEALGQLEGMSSRTAPISLSEFEKFGELIADWPELDLDRIVEAVGDNGFEERPRPSDIFKGRDGIGQLLTEADEEDWMVRLSYTSAQAKTSEWTVGILDFDGREALVVVHPSYTERKLRLDRINWARALTQLEEEAIIAG